MTLDLSLAGTGIFLSTERWGRRGTFWSRPSARGVVPAELGLDMMHGATLGIAPIPFLESGAGVFIAMVYANILFMVSAGSHAAPCIMTRGTAAPWFTQLVYNRRFEATNWNVGADYALSLLAVCTLFILLMMRILKFSLKGIVK